MKKAVKKASLLVLVFTLMVSFSIYNADAKRKKSRWSDDEDDEDIAVLFIPPVFKGDFDDDDIRRIGRNFFKALRKREGYEIYTYKGLSEIIDSSRKIKKIKKCKTKKRCLMKATKRTPLRLVVSGMFYLTDEEEVVAKLVVMDLKEGEILNKIEKTFDSLRQARKKKKMRAVVKILLPKPSKLFGTEDEEEEEDMDEEEEDMPDVATGPRSESRAKPVRVKRARRFTAKQVRKQVREALKKAVAGNIDGCINMLNNIKSKMRCECNEDGRVSDILLLLKDLKDAEERVEKGLKKKSSKDILSGADKLESILAALNTEVKNLRIGGKIRTKKNLKEIRAEGYYYKGVGEEADGKYLKAVESWKKALEYNPAHQGASKKLKSIPKICKRLLAQARTMMTYDPDGAKKKANMVMDLIKNEDDPIYQDALDLIDEIEEFEQGL